MIFITCTDPNAPDNLVEVEVSTSTLKVQWDPPVGEYERFEVNLNEQLQGTLRGDQIEAGELPSFTFDALRPGESYSVSIFAVVGSGNLEKRSPPRQNSFTTGRFIDQFVKNYCYPSSEFLISFETMIICIGKTSVFFLYVFVSFFSSYSLL